MKQKLLNYQPFNEQEEKDKELLLKVIEQKDVLTRKNTIGHFTVSCWVLNQSHDKVLMCFHKIYNSWCWLGGHVDGQKDFKKVALKEFQEESGLKHVQFLKDDPFSIEVLTVNGHIKNGVYVSSHLHYNITYLMEADDQERLIIKEDENKGLQWFDFEEALKASTEPWLVENVYKKLNKKIDVNNEKFKDLMYMYGQALKEMEKKVDIIRYDYEYFKKYDSIDHIMTRIKSPESILNKLKKDEMEPTYSNLVADINDVAGIRIICPLKSDIFTIRKYIREFNDINVIKEKDFVTHPKESGYTSYHMVVQVPVEINKKINLIKVEIQIRSLAMDFWASLEHKIKYKPNGEINDDVSKELVKCARDINKLDNKMIKLFKK